MTVMNERWILEKYPVGMPQPSDFRLINEKVRPLADGEVLLEVIFISLDPGQRHFIDEANGLTALGATVPAWVVGRVADSRSPDFPVGSYARDIMGQGGVQKYSVVPASALVGIEGDAPLSWYGGAVGMSGQTAYFGLLDVGRPVAGETVLVSGATGSVGSVAAQIARIKGCRVIGLARGAEKTRRLKEDFRLDEAIDVQAEDLDAALTRVCPEGIDLFLDNVGGPVLETAFMHMKFQGRIVSTGMMTLYNRTDGPQCLKNFEQLFTRCLRWQGIFVGGYADRYPAASAELAGWARQGELVFDEHIDTGIEKFPALLEQLFTRRPIGKMLLQVGEDRS